MAHREKVVAQKSLQRDEQVSWRIFDGAEINEREAGAGHMNSVQA